MVTIPSEASASRRRLLAWGVVIGGAFLATAAGVPLLGAIIAPVLRREEPRWVPLGAASDFVVGQPRMITVGIQRVDGYRRTTHQRAVWVCRLDEATLVIYNARCTHLGCLVNYRPASRTFLSPCHAGVFALEDGRVLDGPPPRPLDRLEYRVEDGRLLVKYQDFRVGVPEQVPL